MLYSAKKFIYLVKLIHERRSFRNADQFGVKKVPEPAAQLENELNISL